MVKQWELISYVSSAAEDQAKSVCQQSPFVKEGPSPSLVSSLLTVAGIQRPQGKRGSTGVPSSSYENANPIKNDLPSRAYLNYPHTHHTGG